MEKNVLFSIYIVKNAQNGNVLACFSNGEAATTVKNWINDTLYHSEFATIETKDITVDNYHDFDPTDKKQKYYSSATEFIDKLKNEAKSKNYYKLKNHSSAFVKVQNYWWKLDTNTPLNNATIYNYFGGCQSNIDLNGKLIIEADDWSDLDWKGTDVYSDSFKTGWLSPDGDFYGCSNEEHLQQAHFVHKKYENELEQQGWIKIRRDLTKPSQVTALLSYNMKGELIRPTYKQVEYLKDSEINNYEEIEYLIRYKMSKFTDYTERS